MWESRYPAEANELADTLFGTQLWLEAWQQTVPMPVRPQFWVTRRGQEVRGAWALMQAWAPWPVLRPMGLGVSDYLDPVGEPPPMEELAADRPRYLLDFPHQRLPFPGTRSHPGPITLQRVLDSRYDAYEAGLSSRLRYDLRRTRRALTVRTSTDPGDLNRFFALHERRWRRRRLPGSFPRWRKQFLHRVLKGGGLRLTIAESGDGALRGAIIVLSHGDWRGYYQSAIDPDCRPLSPGSLVIAESIRIATDEGAQTFDFLRGGEPYKRAWAPQRQGRNYRCIVPGQGPAARIGKEWQEFASLIESRVRERWEGPQG